MLYSDPWAGSFRRCDCLSASFFPSRSSPAPDPHDPPRARPPRPCPRTPDAPRPPQATDRCHSPTGPSYVPSLAAPYGSKQPYEDDGDWEEERGSRDDTPLVPVTGGLGNVQHWLLEPSMSASFHPRRRSAPDYSSDERESRVLTVHYSLYSASVLPCGTLHNYDSTPPRICLSGGR